MVNYKKILCKVACPIWCPFVCLFYFCKIIWYTKAINLYILDVYTDLRASYYHYIDGNIYWATLTLVFAFIPVLIIGTISTNHGVQRKGRSRRHKCLWTTGGIVTAPIMPLLFFLQDIVASIRDDDDDDTDDEDSNDNESSVDCPIIVPLQTFNNNILVVIKRWISAFLTLPFINQMLTAFSTIAGNGPEDAALSAGLVKLLDVMLESLPQGTLQPYIIAQTWTDWTAVGPWQWITIAVSLMALSFGVSTNPYVFENGSDISKFVVFLFGLMNTTSRIVVCCLYSMILNYLMILPMSVLFIITIVVWFYKRRPECRGNDIWGGVNIFLSWLVTASYDCFTLNGLPVSAVNMAFAVGCWFLPVPQPAAVTVIALASFSLICNIILTTVPVFRKHFGDQWMNRNTLDLSPEEVQRKEFLLKYSCAKDVYVRPIKSGDQEVKGWQTGVYGGSGDMYIREYNGSMFLTPYDRTATVRWRVNWTGCGLTPKAVTVTLPSNSGGAGMVTWDTIIGHKKFTGEQGELQLTERSLEGLRLVRHMDVVVRLYWGYDSHRHSSSWLELFTQRKDNTTDFPFIINIHFND